MSAGQVQQPQRSNTTLSSDDCFAPPGHAMGMPLLLLLRKTEPLSRNPRAQAVNSLAQALEVEEVEGVMCWVWIRGAARPTTDILDAVCRSQCESPPAGLAIVQCWHATSWTMIRLSRV